MKNPLPELFTGRVLVLIVAAFVVGAGVMAAIGALLVNIQERKNEAAVYPPKVVDIPQGTLDPAEWGKNFPHQYDSFRKTEDSTLSTPYGGSVPYDKLERNPNLKTLWAGYAFSKAHNEERGHHYAQIDQQESGRVKRVNQPGACINCHAAETVPLIEEMGWDAFNRTPYNELKDKLHFGSSCNDCHDPESMELRITRRALREALERRGKNPDALSRQEMRTMVCAQCHVEYYFQGENKLLTFPWDNGLSVEEIETYYDGIGFKDWTHKNTGAAMIKIQHPEYELWSTGLHAQSGVSCADCHMPYMRAGAVKVSDHWIRSPLTNINRACQTCHNWDEQTLSERVLRIQNRTASLLERTESALIDAIEAIETAQKNGASDDALKPARALHRKASIRWDFISSENSTGFHSPQESARILAGAVDYARQAQMAAQKAQSGSP